MNTERIKNLIKEKRFEKTWQQKYREVINSYIDKSINHICDHVETKEKIFNEIYVQAYDLEYEIDCTDFMGMKVAESTEIINKIKTKSDELEDKYKKAIEEAIANVIIASSKINDLGDELFKEVLFYVKSKREFDMLVIKRKEFSKKMANMMLSFGYNDLIGNTDDIFYVLRSDLNALERINNRRIKKEESSNLIEEYEQIKKKNKKYLKIFDYKEMIDLAKGEGYTTDIRYNGDHIILTHEISERIVVIPTHELGYGLMIEIQKQIKNNKAA